MAEKSKLATDAMQTQFFFRTNKFRSGR